MIEDLNLVTMESLAFKQMQIFNFLCVEIVF